MSPPEAELRRVHPEDLSSVVDVLCEAFSGYPVMRYVLGEGAEEDGRLRRLVDFFVRARAVRDEPLLAMAEGDDLVAAATVSFPGVAPKPGALVAMARLRYVWRDLGPEARARYDRCGDAWRPLDVEVPHIHVNMIGVRRRHRGKGLARRLLDEVHALSRSDQGSQGVTLTTEDPRNVGFYEHLGYAVVGHVRIAPELESWAMFKPT